MMPAMAFLEETEPARGVALPVLPGISRIVAHNPSVMTYHGTNTYLITEMDGVTVIDPGPPDAAHVAHILAAAGKAPIRRIVLTHTHHDHVGAAPALQAATDAPIYGFHAPVKPGFKPDEPLHDGTEIAGLTAVHTPGHVADHLCFQYFLADGTKILFSGDHVMSWSSSIVSPPEGDMLAYYRSLHRVLARDDKFYLGGHGPLLPEPQKLAAELLAHRQYRENEILSQLRQRDWTIAPLAEQLYQKTNVHLKIAAQRNVLAHMLKLKDEGIVREYAPDTVPDLATMDIPPAPPGIKVDLSEMMAYPVDAVRRFGLTDRRP